MSLSFKLTNSAAESVEYEALSPPDSQGGLQRMALSVDPGELRRDIRRFHIPGVEGNYLIDCGLADGRLTLYVLYRGSAAAIAAALEEDLVILSDGVLTVQVSEGSAEQEYERCLLERVVSDRVEGGRLAVALELSRGH